MKRIFGFTLLSLILCLVILCLGLGWYPGTFQGQPCLYVNGGESVLQRCVDGVWRWFPDPELRWTDCGLHLITEGVCKGGYD